MTKHSRREREQRASEAEHVKRIEAAWFAAMPPERARAFHAEVEVARARGPRQPPPDMAPGTRPNPPRPGREPRPPKDSNRPSRRGRR
jgi:hypothetical protein